VEAGFEVSVAKNDPSPAEARIFGGLVVARLKRVRKDSSRVKKSTPQAPKRDHILNGLTRNIRFMANKKTKVLDAGVEF
jgi:hypothetical protein